MGRFTERDAVSLLEMITEAIPSAKYGPTAAMTFAATLGDLDTYVVRASTLALMQRVKFGLAPADIRDEYYRLCGIGSAEEAWEAVLVALKQGFPWSPVQPLAGEAAALLGGMMHMQMNERPEHMRRDFITAYSNLRDRELSRPSASTKRYLEAKGGDRGELAGQDQAIGPGQAEPGDRHDGDQSKAGEA